MADDKATPPESVEVKLNFRISGRMPTLYAHHMFVQQGQNEVVLSFFEVIPPPVFDPSLDRIKHLQETGVVAECIARITVARDLFPGFAEAMQAAVSQMTMPRKDQEPKPSNADNE